jgi:hypothetical protein
VVRSRRIYRLSDLGRWPEMAFFWDDPLAKGPCGRPRRRLSFPPSGVSLPSLPVHPCPHIQSRISHIQHRLQMGFLWLDGKNDMNLQCFSKRFYYYYTRVELE